MVERIINGKRTSTEGFKELYPFKSNFTDINGNQIHYIDEGKGETILALHGEPSWSYLYRKFIPTLKNYRFIAPDLIGFGKSDKIVGWKNYSFELHFRSLENLIKKLNLLFLVILVLPDYLLQQLYHFIQLINTFL